MTAESPRRFHLANSAVTLESGPVGIIARIDRANGRDYAGPLPPTTIDALAEVADD